MGGYASAPPPHASHGSTAAAHSAHAANTWMEGFMHHVPNRNSLIEAQVSHTRRSQVRVGIPFLDSNFLDSNWKPRFDSNEEGNEISGNPKVLECPSPPVRVSLWHTSASPLWKRVIPKGRYILGHTWHMPSSTHRRTARDLPWALFGQKSVYLCLCLALGLFPTPSPWTGSV
jgi:hypothetical protein